MLRCAPQMDFACRYLYNICTCVARWNVAEGAYSRLVMELEPFSPAAWEGIGRCLDAAGNSPSSPHNCFERTDDFAVVFWHL